jgi:Nif-specific regulatory protein
MAKYLLVLTDRQPVQHPVTADGLTIGHARDVDVVLSAPGVAARHARVRLHGDRALVEPLEGAIEPRELRVGEEVTVASGVRLRLVESGQPQVQLAKSPDALSFDALTGADPDRAVRFQRRFQLLMQMARTVGAGTDYQGVLDKLMDVAHRGLEPERAVLAMLEADASGQGRIRFEAARHARSEDPWHDLHVSGTILGRVISSGEAFIVADAAAAEQLAQAYSISTQGIRSALCVPFHWRGSVAGALYVDHRGDANYFDEDDLDFLLMLSQLATVALQNVQDYEMVRDEVRALREAMGGETALVGDSGAMATVRQLTGKVARSDLPVLIQGERGTGKELVARAIHALSSRAAFVAVNCAAIPETLTESAFFGHEQGAFTGASHPHRGYFEQAQGGTLFLDEIGDLKPPAQAAILRALQEGEIRRVGSLETVTVDVRIISATNRDLEGGEFRADLYDRLNVLRIDVPPLRARAEDIPQLAAHFVGGRVKRISAKALRHLRDYAWPGNVRELKNVVERAIVMGDGETIWPEDLPPSVREHGKEGHYHLMSLETLERDHIIRVLRHTQGNVSHAARVLGIGRLTIYKKLKAYGLETRDFKD